MRLLALIGALAILVAAPAGASGQVLTKRVTDDAHLLSEVNIADLSARLAKLETETGAQVVVYTTPSLNGQDIETFSNTVFRETGIGQKGKDNGVLLVVAPTERKVRIEVGRRLEPTLTDADAKMIIVNVMKPYLHKGGTDNWPVAIRNAVVSIENYVRQDYVEQTASQEPEIKTAWPSDVVLVVMMFGFVALVLVGVELVTRRRHKPKTESYVPPPVEHERSVSRRYPSAYMDDDDDYRRRRYRSRASGALAGAAAAEAYRSRDSYSRSDDGGRSSYSDSPSFGGGSSDSFSFGSSSDNSFSGGGGDSGGGGASSDV